MTGASLFELRTVARVRSAIRRLEDAPLQGSEGAPDAWLEVEADLVAGLEGIEPGDELWLITWFHLASRDVLRLHPRGDASLPLTGVFATRSPDRPNPLGLHRVGVRAVEGLRLLVGPLEALDGTPVVDIKPVLQGRE